MSDLFKEKIDHETNQYFVDNEWLDLEIITHEIKIKDGESISYDVKSTHRGPLMESSLIKNAQVLFGSAIPVHEDFGDFSLAWSGAMPGETMFELHNSLVESKTVRYVEENLYRMEYWKSAPINMVMADRSGNIGYMLLSASPIRKNWYPYLGCGILDGTTTFHDWEGIAEI